MGKTTEQRLQYLEDRLAIQDVVNRYARGIDRHDDELLRAVFHEDAVDRHGAWTGEREAFVQWANHEVHNAFAAHTHCMTTHSCEVDGDEAHAETYAIYALRRREDDKVLIGGARYLDRLERRDGQWRVVTRRVITDWRCIGEPPPGAFAGAEYSGTWDKTDPSYQRPLTIGDD